MHECWQPIQSWFAFEWNAFMAHAWSMQALIFILTTLAVMGVVWLVIMLRGASKNTYQQAAAVPVPEVVEKKQEAPNSRKSRFKSRSIG